MKNQILLLEELGIPKGELDQLVQQSKLSYDFIDDPAKANTEKVEILITIKTKIDTDLLGQYPNVKAIAVAFTGYDAVDLQACKEKQIAVYNVPAYSTNAVAELAVGLAISLLREIPAAHNLTMSKSWSLRPGQELAGKTVGILGTGTIGTLTANFFKAFGCNIIGWSRSQREEFTQIGSYINDLQEFCQQADIISVHVPSNPNTKDLLSTAEFGSMKESAYLINTARGPIINEQALIKALKNKQIAGAALDVFCKEPIDPNNELLNLENVILTPHIAYKTREALKRRAAVTIENIVSFAERKGINRIA